MVMNGDRLLTEIDHSIDRMEAHILALNKLHQQAVIRLAELQRQRHLLVEQVVQELDGERRARKSAAS